MLLLTFSWKNFFIFIFSLFFFNYARKSCSPFMKLFFPHDKFLQEKFPQHIPLFSTPPPPTNLKIPQKTSVLFQITITICKHLSKFVICVPSHRNCGGVSRPQKHSYIVFWLRWIKWLSQNCFSEFISELWENN